MRRHCDDCHEDDDECDICDGCYSWESPDWQDDEEDPRMCCLGDACLCPHPNHTASECFDAEMAREWEAEMSAVPPAAPGGK